MSEQKTYLGDSVYADVDGRAVMLTTENGRPGDPSNTIYLEPEVLVALVSFAARLPVYQEAMKAFIGEVQGGQE